MSLASQTRETVKNHPCIHEALRAGVINYSAAARFLPIAGDTEAIASALRRYEEQLASPTTQSRDVSISMHSSYPSEQAGFSEENPSDIDTETVTWLCVSGNISPAFVGSLLLGCKSHEIPIHAVSANEGTAVICVPRSTGAAALRCIENVLNPPSG